MKYFILSGESSGDLQGSLLMQAIHKEDAHAQFVAWGGDKMMQQGAIIKKHFRELAFMGFVEVLKNIFTISRNFAQAKKDIAEFKPDVLIFIDYPGFNLRMASWAKKAGLTAVYYISPQLWAWKENRIKIIKNYIDLLICILPFEEEWYRQRGVKVHYVGHPLMMHINQAKKDESITLTKEQWHAINGKKIIALLPGSRLQEIKKKLPIMLEMVEYFPDYHFAIACTSHIAEAIYTEIIGSIQHVSLVKDNTYGLLKNAYAALVTSGTATLETALFDVPQVVCYKANTISYQIGKRLIKVPFISLVNLIANKKVVEELIQDEFNAITLKKNLALILDDQKRKSIHEDYSQIRKTLQGDAATKKAAVLITNLISKNSSNDHHNQSN